MPNYTVEPPGLDFVQWMQNIERYRMESLSASFNSYFERYSEEEHASAQPAPTEDAEVVQLQEGCIIINGVIVKKRNV